MKLIDFTKERFTWLGSIIAIMLLTLIPFAPVHEGARNTLSAGLFTATVWHLIGQFPVILVLMAVLIADIIVSIFKIGRKLKARIILVLNLTGIVFFLYLFLGIAPKMAMGIGSIILFFFYLLFIARTLSLLGFIRGDSFISGSVLTLALLLVIFIIFPIVVILSKSIVAKGSLHLSNFYNVLAAYPSTVRILKNSLLMAATVGILSTLVGLAFALVIERSRFKLKRYMQGFSLLPIITPPFVIGLAIIFMFGRVGFLTHNLLGLRTSFIFGFPGIVIAQTLSFAPMSYLILSGVVHSLDSALEEASYTLGAGRWYTFKHVVWPLIRPGIANAFLLSVIESLADFGNPILLGGDFDVLATSIYLAIIGRFDEALAASLGIVLLSITLTTFLIQRYWVGKKSYVTITGKPRRQSGLPLPKYLDYGLLAFTLIWALFTMVLYGSVFMGGFVKLWGINNSFTLMHYKRFLVDGLASFITTLKLASISAPLTAVVGLLIAYLVSRYKFIGKRPFEFTSMLSFAIPGTVVGIGYVMAFNTPPLVLTGTATIIVISFIFRNMPVGIRAGMAALRQIDPSLEEASITLGANNITTLNRVVIPLIKPALFSGLVFSFVRAMTAISAVIFLVTARTKLATVVILARIEAGKLGLATAYCTIMIVSMVIVISLMYFILKRMGGTDTGVQAI